ncbi:MULTISPECIES: adenosylcobinamide-GDP ribazoletransferase [Brevibacillus]|uniref:adenosylcobinamide-GDP ribazoletransferase n=1 Tax=Brevibacillus TaxID=55080 RepID=UPI000EE15BB5|nr:MULTISPECIES: adenosylcobinamide-GDP ribazoletransferase [Brevibacillus]MBU8712651.1 adenosylcobinamide-GDP ribazoletransferase [Brevibacillus parabrevis]MDR5000275.1 adenosylcobinamide-GDP ribazoletransferase [Brevibacillus parabrevis]NRQ52676.1 adenosylcobinamide-GDP ribazoletransferase [Brevibacillus sp. HD1.4A]UED70236.1 adenosylcobinamide-GDP ribazoletransferase [Brevibacillus sp. HD3.3A]HBZ79794.1 adenosylcobinamide-GDP ribazoletransferase [Brevibacillus sp.]
MNAFWHAIAFFTRIPVPWLRPSDEAWKKSVNWYPAVGLVIGILLWGVHQAGLSLFSPWLAAVLTLVVWVYITGGLHLDGWMDLADGLGSSRPKEQVLAIMKDSRVGAFGVLAALLLLLLKAGALAELTHPGWGLLLVFVPAAARTHVLLAIRFWPYLSADKGIGKGISAGLSLWAIVIGYVALLAAGWLAGGWQVVAAIAGSCLFALLFCRSVARKLGGLNGDCYGAVIESSEAVMLLVLVGSWWL